MITPLPAISEIQGLYGAFSFPEKLLQKIWLRRDFDVSSACTLDGRRLRVAHPGKWNQLGGPDFRAARIRFAEDPEVVGDVELHLHASDWDAHAHARDPAYAGVILHVVLFVPPPGHQTIGAGGKPLPVLALLPLLHHDLEEYAADDAVETLANRPVARLTNELGAVPADELKPILLRCAAERWRQRVHYARLRVQRLGWEAACHHAALEVLGFRYNRAPMLRIAGRWPLSAWETGQVNVDDLWAVEAETWSLQGVRPANQPRTRLRQYLAWTSACRGWPAKLARFAVDLPEIDPKAATRMVRRQHRFSALRRRFATNLCGNAVGGSRLDNLVCDAFFPLLAAGAPVHPGAGWWHHWFCGDVPPFVNTGLRFLGVYDRRDQPACHGLAQGLLGWLIQRELRR